MLEKNLYAGRNKQSAARKKPVSQSARHPEFPPNVLLFQWRGDFAFSFLSKINIPRASKEPGTFPARRPHNTRPEALAKKREADKKYRENNREKIRESQKKTYEKRKELEKESIVKQKQSYEELLKANERLLKENEELKKNNEELTIQNEFLSNLN